MRGEARLNACTETPNTVKNKPPHEYRVYLRGGVFLLLTRKPVVYVFLFFVPPLTFVTGLRGSISSRMAV
jgi:hypothetical protein